MLKLEPIVIQKMALRVALKETLRGTQKWVLLEEYLTHIYMWIRECTKHKWQMAQLHGYQGKLKKLLEVTEFCLRYTCLKIFEVQ